MNASEIDRLGCFIMENCSFEIGVGDFVHGESAVDVAIRLLTRLAGASQKALLELGVPSADYPAPVANAVEHLKAGLGEWGKA